MLVLFWNRGKVFGLRLKGKGHKLTFLNKVEGFMEEETYLCINHYDYFNEELEIPPVKKENVRELLLKKELIQRLGISSDVVITYGKVSEEEEKYEVYGLGRDFFESVIEGAKREFLQRITLSLFALGGLGELFKGKSILLCYLGFGNLILSFYNKGRIDFVRGFYLESAEESFLREVVGTSVGYLLDRRGRSFDGVVLGGELAEKEDLAEEILTLYQIPTFTLLSFVKNLSDREFNQYLPLFGALLLKNYDFTTKEIQEGRKALKILKFATNLLILSFLPLISYTLYGGFTFYSNFLELIGEKEKLSKSLESLSRLGLTQGDVKYYSQYLKDLKGVKENPNLKLLNGVKLIMETFQIDSFKLEKNSCRFKKEFSFNSYTRLKAFEALLKATEAKLRGMGYRVKNRSRIILEKLSYDFDLEISS